MRKSGFAILAPTVTTLLFTIIACGPQTRTSIPTREPVTQTRSAAPARSPIPDHLNVVTIGDSLAYGTGDESRRGLSGRLLDELRARGVADPSTVNLGVNGAQTKDLLARLQQPRVRTALAGAGAVVLSIGANDLFRTAAAREETLRAPLGVAERILGRLDEIVSELHLINPRARVLILGGYNPVPNSQYGRMVERYIGTWDGVLAGHFEDDPLVSIVKMSDLITPGTLSRYDSFHPGQTAYAAVAARIASMLVERNQN